MALLLLDFLHSQQPRPEGGIRAMFVLQQVFCDVAVSTAAEVL